MVRVHAVGSLGIDQFSTCLMFTVIICAGIGMSALHAVEHEGVIQPACLYSCGSALYA